MKKRERRKAKNPLRRLAFRKVRVWFPGIIAANEGGRNAKEYAGWHLSQHELARSSLLSNGHFPRNGEGVLFLELITMNASF